MSALDQVRGWATRKLGPLPVWGWAVGAAGGIWVWRALSGRIVNPEPVAKEDQLSYGVGSGLAVAPPPPAEPVFSTLSISTPDFSIEGAGPDVMSIIGQWWQLQHMASQVPAPAPAAPVQAPPPPAPVYTPPPPAYQAPPSNYQFVQGTQVVTQTNYPSYYDASMIAYDQATRAAGLIPHIQPPYDVLT